MLISHLKLKNWRNFTQVDIPLQKRQFIVGPNASGKSNLLDSFRFLRDIAKQKGGGLQQAIEKRGGLSKIRCLSARRDPEIRIVISFNDSVELEYPLWKYEIGIKQETRGYRLPYLSCEKVYHKGRIILERPDKEDEKDIERLKQTCLEQVNNNQSFREIAQYFDKITYMHLVPQLLRNSDDIQGRILEDDPFGQGFLESMAKTTSRDRNSRLKKINEIIKVTVPRLQEIAFERDKDTGRPHITALYSHWRPKAGLQREDQFSDGTLRLMALIWSLLESGSLLLLEEPELSLHEGIVKKMAVLLYQTQKRRNRQVFISTHSADLLSDKGISGEEVLVLEPNSEGTEVTVASELTDVRSVLDNINDISVGELVIPRTRPEKIEQFNRQLRMFG